MKPFHKVLCFVAFSFMLVLTGQILLKHLKQEKSKWVYIGTGLDDTVVSYDKTHFSKVNNIAYVIMKTDSPEEVNFDSSDSYSKKYSTIISTLKINCTDSTVEEGTAKYYGSKSLGLIMQRGYGELISGPNYIAGFTIDPGTNISKLKEIVCKVK